jgi:methionyl aminopeptidase
MIITTEEERNNARKSGKILVQVLDAVEQVIVPGVSTQELEDVARAKIKELGATPAFLGYAPSKRQRPFPAVLCVSLNDEIVHGIPNEDVSILQEGDIVAIDCGVVYNGFITDSARTVAVGEISKEDQRLIDATKEALAEQIKVVKVGNTVGDIGFAAEQVAAKYGYDFPEDLGGHGVGKEVHEDPFIPNWGDKGTGEKLVEGQVIAIEPMLNHGVGDIVLAKDGYTYKTADGKRSAHFEHTMIVGKNGAEVLTK